MMSWCIAGSSAGSEHSRVLANATTATAKSGGSSASESGVEIPHKGKDPHSRSGGSRSSGSSVATATTSPQPHPLPPTGADQDLSASRQSFRIAMGNPCEFFVDVM